MQHVAHISMSIAMPTAIPTTKLNSTYKMKTPRFAPISDSKSMTAVKAVQRRRYIIGATNWTRLTNSMSNGKIMISEASGKKAIAPCSRELITKIGRTTTSADHDD